VRAVFGTLLAFAGSWRGLLERHLRIVGPARQVACHFVWEREVAEDKSDIRRLVDEAAKGIGLVIAPEYRANVILNYERSMAIAQPLLEAELDDELTPAPVFRP
jgi:hypothetical protein